MKRYDLAVIGSGPGGYVAALYAAGNKTSVCLIESDLLGGTCLNRGCIPTKALVISASVLATVRDAATFGVSAGPCSADFPAMMRRKDESVGRLRTGIEALLRAKGVEVIKGRARIAGPNAISVDGSDSVEADNIIIASGSRSAAIRGMDIDESDILTSDGALGLRAVPKSIVIAGGGAIGCEFATIFNSLGSKVTIIEMMDRLLPAMSAETSKRLEAGFKKKGVDVRLGTKIESAAKSEGGVAVRTGDGAIVEAEKALVAVGRTANIELLGLDKADILTRNGRIAVDGHLKTARANIYAIGDCVDGPQLAHKASYDAILACDNIMGKSRTVDYTNIPNCVWTEPEAAMVGMTEEEAKKTHPEARTAKFPYLGSGKAYIERKTEGYVKITGSPDGRILGVEILGKGACDLIGEAVLAKTYNITIEEWSRSVHAHPTLSESLQEAAHIFCGNAIHTI